MVPISFSSELEYQAQGFLADNCLSCDEVRAFCCYRAVRAWKLFDAKVRDQSLELVVICCFCRMSFALPPDANAQVDALWHPEDGLQVLVDRTNPALGTVRQRNQPSGRAIQGLLRSLENQRHNYIELLERTSAREVVLGALSGGIILAIAGNLVVYLGPHNDRAWSASVFFASATPGILLGAIIGGIIGAIRMARNETVEDLKATMRFYNLRCSQLREELMKAPDSLRRVVPIVEMLCERDTG